MYAGIDVYWSISLVSQGCWGFIIIHRIPVFFDFVGIGKPQISMFNKIEMFYRFVCRLFAQLQNQI